MPADGGQERTVTTDAAGRFVVDTPAVAQYTFSSTGTGVCVDAVSGTATAFPYSLTLPPLPNATITAISLLTVPARSDAALVAKYPELATGGVPQELWSEVYAMFGYTAQVCCSWGRY